LTAVRSISALSAGGGEGLSMQVGLSRPRRSLAAFPLFGQGGGR
jgi:hypothetical protein